MGPNTTLLNEFHTNTKAHTNAEVEKEHDDQRSTLTTPQEDADGNANKAT